MGSPIDDFCEQVRADLHAKKLKCQTELDLLKRLIADLEVARQAELVAAFSAEKKLRAPVYKGPSTEEVCGRLLAAVQGLSEMQRPAGVAGEPAESDRPLPLDEPRAPIRAPHPDPRPNAAMPWPELLKSTSDAPIVVVGGSPRPEKLDGSLGPLAARVEWIETSRHGTHAIGNLAQRIRQRRVSALIVLDAVVGHKHSDPLVSAAREVRIPTTYAHKGGVAALARAFTQLEKMVGAR